VLSIIVPARNSREFTRTCLETILHSVGLLKLKCQFILIDDNSDAQEGILDVFRQHRAQARGHKVEIIRCKTHQHYSGVFSIGLHHASEDVIFFISNDMIVPPRFLEALLCVSALSSDFGIVRGTSNYCDSHPEHVVVPPQPLKSFRDVEAASQTVFGAYGCTYAEDEVLSGDAILIKRALVERIGVLDLRFFGYFGDVDYGMRAHLAGFKLVCAKGAWLYHLGAGHVKREAERQRADFEALHRHRMAMVQAAYQEFRRKWYLEKPETYDDQHTLQHFGHARANAHRVPLKFDFPLSVLGELEYH
jgi:GT2 family glycosyltransferase